ncbi:MAG: hypothetical protein J6N74_07850, partial [Chryseobacterium sp.]|nr:hypothetical protein [Chryseobacterium sp.]
HFLLRKSVLHRFASPFVSKNCLTFHFIIDASLPQKSVINKTLQKQSYKTDLKKQPDKTERDLWLGKQMFLFRF